MDPSEGMREVFSRYTTDDRVVVSEGTFDRTGIESGWADLIVIAQVCRPKCGPYTETILKSVSRHSTGALTMKQQQPSLLGC